MLKCKGMRGLDIRQLRRQLSLTQAELGQLIGAHGVTVSRWETDTMQPSPYQAALLAEFQAAAQNEAFGRTVKNLLVGAGIAAAILLLLKAASK